MQYVVFIGQLCWPCAQSAHSSCHYLTCTRNYEYLLRVWDHAKPLAHNKYMRGKLKDLELKPKHHAENLLNGLKGGMRGEIKGNATVSYTHLTLPTTPYV